MKIQWKILCGFGAAFWLCMCGIDYMFGNIVQHGEFSKILEIEEIDEVPENEEPKRIISTIGSIPTSGQLTWYEILMWASLSVVVAIGLCFATRRIKQMLYRDEQFPTVLDTTGAPEFSSTSAQSVPLIIKSSGTSTTNSVKTTVQDDETQTKTNLLEITKEFGIPLEKKESLRRLKQIRREDNSEINAWKEYANIVKKYDSLLLEKKNLLHKNALLVKENEYVTKQLNDILNDRTMLLKRLESATKEIKQNTCNKQITLEKLEESIACSNEMKVTIIQLSNDKIELENKIKQLEEKIVNLKNNTTSSPQQQGYEIVSRNLVYLDEDVERYSKDIIMHQAEGDIEIEKVQNKLHDLEKSLERIKSNKSPITVMKDDSEEDFSLVKDKDNNIIDERIELGFINDDTDVDDSVKTDLNVTSTDETFSETDKMDHKTPSTESNLSSGYTTSEVTNSEADQDTDIFTKGIVSKSPAFQKFLLKVLDNPLQQDDNEIIL